jgi:hypothetical protein
MAVEVVNAMPVRRSIRAVPNNIPWFLVILSQFKNFDSFI